MENKQIIHMEKLNAQTRWHFPVTTISGEGMKSYSSSFYMWTVLLSIESKCVLNLRLHNSQLVTVHITLHAQYMERLGFFMARGAYLILSHMGEVGL